ncbi:MAG TPA: urea ABC transporter ATP-binding subunit UrtE [Synechococcus sp. M44_DOE_062]|nr:urea ABC transporter ATP-binding subunit UrtE [Synechococcus sp. M44_DOE_062]
MRRPMNTENATATQNLSRDGSGPLLEVSDLRVYYGQSLIVKDLSFKIFPGQAVCLLGRNGMGKTTTLKALMGLLKDCTGKIAFEGRPINHYPPNWRARAGIGYVPQGREIFPRLTVEENLLVGLEAAPNKERIIPEFIYDLFPILRSFLKRLGGDLSGGQQQQLAIARALVAEPKLLLLDEPTEGIQPSIIIEIEEAITRIQKERGVSVLLVEQYFEFAQSLADYFYLMENGSLIMEGPTDQMDEEKVRAHLSI